MTPNYESKKYLFPDHAACPFWICLLWVSCSSSPCLPFRTQDDDATAVDNIACHHDEGNENIIEAG